MKIRPLSNFALHFIISAQYMLATQQEMKHLLTKVSHK